MSEETPIDEDTPITSLHTHLQADNDPDEETQDFRLFANLLSRSSASTNPTIPKRGEKDFESHGTKHQDGVLEASRMAMHDALAYTRVHSNKNWVRGWWCGEEESMEGLEDRRGGLENDHVVMVSNQKGSHFKTMGKMTTGHKKGMLWLLPEEALYLVERGDLDLWWPNRGTMERIAEGEVEDVEGEEDLGTPMSLQAAYALLLGNDVEVGKVSLDRYTVYGNLKRTGYIPMRAPEWDPSKPGMPKEQQQLASIEEPQSIFTLLWGKFFAEKETRSLPYGPLVKPGMYRSYTAIYRQLSIIPHHEPSPTPEKPAEPPSAPYRVIFHIWKAGRTTSFTKSSPGIPDFRIAVTSSRDSFVPTLSQMSSLLESTPWDPPSAEMKGSGRMYQRVKHGWRNVILAVVDQGVISYLRLGEAAFGKESLVDRMDFYAGGGALAGGKRGGGGRGRGRGRGRGIGRGG